MVKAKKTIIIVFAILAIIALSGIVKAGITDSNTDEEVGSGTGQIVRKTTTNYFTTVKIEGTFSNEKNGQTETFSKTSDELSGNVDNENVTSVIESLKNDFNTWAANKGVKTDNITFNDESISDYYYDAHDEITQSNITGNSDVILVGDIDDIDNAYASQGTITIETILDKHQTYTIKATATIPDNDIKNIDIFLAAPTIGDTVTVTPKTDPEYGFAYEEADKHPNATSKTNNVVVDFTYWISGTHIEIGDEYDKLFNGTFEKDKYYYAEIGILADNNYAFAEGVTIKVNGENPAEVFGLYSNNTGTHFIAKIKASEQNEEPIVYEYLEGANQTYTINKDSECTFKINADYSLFENGGKVFIDGKEVSSENYTSESGSTIITFKKDYMSSLSEGEHTLQVAFTNNGTATTNFSVITEKRTDLANPATGDSILIMIAIFVIACIGLFATIMINKKHKIGKHSN